MPITMRTHVITALVCALIVAGCGEDQQTASAPTVTDSSVATVSDARAGQELAAERGANTSVDVETGYRPAAKIEQITWKYGPCTNAKTLIPPPLEGWGLLNDTPLGEWPVNVDSAQITFTFADNTLDPQSNAYGQSKQNTSIYISSGTPTTEGLEQFLNNEQLRDGMFEPGPYNYPVQKYANGTLVGPYFVQVDGNGNATKEYFAKIIKCAIDSGLIANGVDASSLRETR